MNFKNRFLEEKAMWILPWRFPFLIKSHLVSESSTATLKKSHPKTQVLMFY